VERRAAARVGVSLPVRVATMSEQPLPAAESVDASQSGVLVALAEPFGLVNDTRVCVSMPADDGRVHLMGRVRRVERGDDFRTYVALSLDEPDSVAERDRWHAWLRGHAPAPT
jgi:hypothetical protein